MEGGCRNGIRIKRGRVDKKEKSEMKKATEEDLEQEEGRDIAERTGRMTHSDRRKLNERVAALSVRKNNAETLYMYF